jgi:5S rRNA maturation endonuclease (ribonuclease M5)
MTDPLQTIETALRQRVTRISRRDNQIVAQCPAHQDNNPSLTVSRGDRQNIVLHCFAGCTPESVLAALELKWSDLADDEPFTSEPVTYLYEDQNGLPLYRVVRTPDKKFWQQRLDMASGEWVNGLGGLDRTLYRLPEVVAGINERKVIWICEGEKDVDRLRRQGCIATCNSGGAGKFTEHMADLLAGAHFVNIVADNDEPGQAHATRISELLTERSINHDVWLPLEGKDVSDHLNRGHLLEQLKPWAPGQPVDHGTSGSAELAHLVNWTEFWTQTHAEENWVAWPLIPEGRTIALYAPAKAGKSTVVLAVAVAAATGVAPLKHSTETYEPQPILYLDYEMTPADLYERLSELGYGADTDLSRLHYALLPSIPPLDTAEGAEHLVTLALELGVKAVVVDTFGRAVAGDENDADTVRHFYRHTGQVLKHHGIACLRTDHSGKDLDKGQRGSSAKNDDVDVVFRLSRAQNGVVLARTHSRISWAPERIEIARIEHDAGVSYEIAPRKQYPDGTASLAETLDELDVPIETTVARAGAALREAGHRASNEKLRAAIQMRKERHLDPFETDRFHLPKQQVSEISDEVSGGLSSGLRKTSTDGSGNGSPRHNPANPLNTGGSQNGSLRHENSSDSGSVPLSKSGTKPPPATDDPIDNLF